MAACPEATCRGLPPSPAGPRVDAARRPAGPPAPPAGPRSPPIGGNPLKASAPMVELAVCDVGGPPSDDLDRNGSSALLEAAGEFEVKYLLGRIEETSSSEIGTGNGPFRGAGHGAVWVKREVIDGPGSKEVERDSPIPNGDEIRTR